MRKQYDHEGIWMSDVLLVLLILVAQNWRGRRHWLAIRMAHCASSWFANADVSISPHETKKSKRRLKQTCWFFMCHAKWVWRAQPGSQHNNMTRAPELMFSIICTGRGQGLRFYPGWYRKSALLEIHYLTWKVGYWFRDRVTVTELIYAGTSCKQSQFRLYAGRYADDAITVCTLHFFLNHQ